MIPSAVLYESTTTRTAMNTALNNNHSVPARSNDQHGFGVYQLMTVNASDATIRTLVPVSISAPPYRKTLIAKLFYRQILGHAGSPSISCSNLVTTVATYFDMSTAMVEREEETAADSIRDSIFRVRDKMEHEVIVNKKYLNDKHYSSNNNNKNTNHFRNKIVITTIITIIDHELDQHLIQDLHHNLFHDILMIDN